MTTKNIVLSKTIIGAIIAVAPQIADLIGFVWPDGLSDELMGFIGFALVIWGRLTATTKLTVLPQK